MQKHTCSTYHMMRKSLTCALLLAAAILPAREAQADVQGVTSIPVNHNIAIKRTASVSLTWKVVLVTTTPPPGPIVFSQQGVFSTPAGQTLGSVNTPLTTATSGASIVFIKERLLIPARIVTKAQSMGANQVQYRRLFKNGGGNGILGTLFLNITGSAGAGFSISREALSFTDK